MGLERSMSNKWVVRFDAGMCGTDEYRACIAETAEEACSMYEAEAWEHFWNHNEADDWEDEIGSVNGIQAELDIWAEEFDENKHAGWSHLNWDNA